MTRINLTLSKENLHQLVSGDDQGMSMLLKEVLDQVLEHQRTEQVATLITMNVPLTVRAIATAISYAI